MKISSRLLSEIERKKYLASQNSSYTLYAQRGAERYLRSLADAYTFWLNHPSKRAALLDTLNASDKIRGDSSKTIQFLKAKTRENTPKVIDAWRYLINVQKGIPLAIDLTVTKVLEMGRIVDPVENVGFRTSDNTLSWEYNPPSWANVPCKVYQACEAITSTIRDPVEDSALIHLMLIGIQPFNSGNKRVANIIHTRILRDAKLPSIIIPQEQRNQYMGLLRRALRDYSHSSSINEFGNYMAERVIVSLDQLIQQPKARVTFK